MYYDSDGSFPLFVPVSVGEQLPLMAALSTQRDTYTESVNMLYFTVCIFSH